MKITKLVVASHNAGKIAEIKALMSPLHIEVCSASDLRLDDVEETGTTFEENARLKADTLSLKCGLPCLADDSGLCVDALNGRPGVYSARYAPERDFKKGMQKLLEEIKSSSSSNRKAHFSCCLALACPNQKTLVFEGRVDGVIAEHPQGKLGFGYDPIFIPDGFDKTFAELGDDVKNKISHRRRAFEKLLLELR
ncbi:MAG: RdgB/HAM1 family non-canonical purine NTP pyrophosphatase [Alphaproteobacteria bacterium]|nr:RdgB/HAM1 family non-canonical purine NTP pyrophosphatase [Alphaproteobacteria bacterium]